MSMVHFISTKFNTFPLNILVYILLYTITKKKEGPSYTRVGIKKITSAIFIIGTRHVMSIIIRHDLFSLLFPASYKLVVLTYILGKVCFKNKH